MKKVLFSAAIVVFTGTAIWWAVQPKAQAHTHQLRHSEGMEEDARARMEYELARLAGPDGKIPDHIREKELAFAATLPGDGSLANARSATQAQWTNRGPWNVGGRTRAFAIDIANENHLIAGSTSGGIWNSTDAGASWSKLTPTLSYHGITCLAQDKRPGHTQTWYAGSGEAYGQSASGGSAYFLGNGMLKSTDNGATWTAITASQTNTPQSFDAFWDLIWNIQTDHKDTANDVVYAACLGAIYRSLNGGTNWTTLRGGSTSAYSYFTDIAVTPDSAILYATLSSDGPQRGIWRSTNQGGAWTKISTPLFGDSLCNRIVAGINPSNPNEIYFLANTNGIGMPDTNYFGDIEWNALWRYTYLGGNGSGSGGQWEDLSANIPTNGVGPFEDFNAQGSYDLVVAVKPNDPNTVFIGGTNIYRSTNRFNDTQNTTYIGGYELGTSLPLVESYLNHHPDQHGIAFLPSNADVMYSANDGGVFRTNNCMAPQVSWTSLNNGYLTTQFYTVALDHGTAGSTIIAAGAQDNGTWWINNSSPTASWSHPRGGDGSYVQIEDGAGMYYFSIQNGKMNKATLDAGGNPTAVRRIDPIGGEKYLFINPFALDPNNQNIMYLAGGKYLWRNSNLAGIALTNQWDTISTNWTRWNDSVPTANSRITAVTVCKTPANRVYYGTDRRRVYRVDNANTGTPAPVDITDNTFPGTGYVSSIAVNPNNGDEVMVVYSNYGLYSLFYSADGGTTWKRVAGNLEQAPNGSGNGPSLRWASIMPVSNGMVYLVATSTGLYATDTLIHNGTVWVRQGENSIGAVVCDMIDVRTSDGTVAVATHANGIYTATITSVNDIVSVQQLAPQPQLSLGLYPNPASNVLNIQATLPQAGQTMLELLDERGRPVQRKALGRRPEGAFNEQLNVEGLPAGMYYVRIVCGTVQGAKMVMVN
ncbi:MAG: T9SS type A sorting domain-containing protein [Bacteroidetes bacterium]|nr:T9SS type A sorting domain-containing protein [Bacteroidota bacterium]